MKVIVLAAGYATRMYPLTLNYPKALLPLNGLKVLDKVLQDLLYKEDINIVVNNRFKIYFDVWNIAYDCKLINNKTNNVNESLGVVEDLKLGIENINDDILVLAGDTVYDFNLYDFINYANSIDYSSCMYYVEKNIHNLQKTGVADILNDTLITLQEKPNIPKTQFAVPPCYLFKKKDLDIIRRDNSKTFGEMLNNLAEQTVVKCFKMPGNRIDYGTLEQFNYINPEEYLCAL